MSHSYVHYNSRNNIKRGAQPARDIRNAVKRGCLHIRNISNAVKRGGVASPAIEREAKFLETAAKRGSILVRIDARDAPAAQNIG